MLTPRFILFVETREGEIIKAFTWCKDEASGLLRAAYDAAQFGYDVKRIWAEPVVMANAD